MYQYLLHLLLSIFPKFFIHIFCIIILYPIHQFFFCHYSSVCIFHFIQDHFTVYSFYRQFSCRIDRQQNHFICHVQHFRKSICKISCSGVQMRLKNHRTFFLSEQGLCPIDQCPQFFRVMSIIINKNQVFRF